MKKLHLALVFSLAVLTASAQKVYFIYIQTESEQPFFVKMDNKVHSSTASGYIILSKLIDSTYSFSIGFPQNKWGEQNFSVTLGKKDHGFLLKNFGEKGWGLFDLQTLTVQMAVGGKAGIDVKPGAENTDVSAFTEILSKAANDVSLKEKPVRPIPEEKKTEPVVEDLVKKEESKTVVTDPGSQPVAVSEEAKAKTAVAKEEVKETVVKPADVTAQPVEKKDDPKTEVKEIVNTKPAEAIEQPAEKKEEPVVEIKEQAVAGAGEVKPVTAEPYKASLVKRWSESSTTEGFGLVFIDDYPDGVKDTIRLFIPNPAPAVNAVKEAPREEKKFLDITAEAPKKEDEKIIVQNDCNEIATEADFFKLRKRMAAAESDDEMIAEASKYYKGKCFSTEQVKNLGTLFLTDAGKYKFFDASYKYVLDAAAFNSLQSELKDEYYASQFRSMLRN